MTLKPETQKAVAELREALHPNTTRSIYPSLISAHEAHIASEALITAFTAELAEQQRFHDSAVRSLHVQLEAAKIAAKKTESGNSTTCGQSILDERKRLRKALEFYADESKWRVAEASEAFKIGDVEIGAGEPFMGFNDGEDHPWSVAAEALAPAPEERS